MTRHSKSQRTLTRAFTLFAALALSVGCGSSDDAETATSANMSANPSPNIPGNDSQGGAGTDGGTGTDGSVFDGGVGGPPPVEQPIPDNTGDNFEEVGTNPFVLTSADPFSTFAADVDTASYDIFRRDVGFGLLPKAASVRLEEYINYFSYDYPVPESGSAVPFAIDLAAGPSPMAEETTLLRVGIKGLPLAELDPKPANLVFLIDVSGSMSSGSKLTLVKKVLTETLEILNPNDTVSIVTYAGNTGVALTPTKVSSKATIEAKINSFTSGGSTNGAGGIQLAYQQAEAAFLEDGINHVILCTDGDFNVGVSGTQALTDLIVEKRKSGVTLTVLGFGIGNLNDAMMESVSNAGNGVYGVISDADHAVDYVYKRMLSSLYFIAKDMKIQVVFNPEMVEAYRLLGYENRDIADDDFKDDTVDAGEIGAGHTVTALYEVVMKGTEIPMSDTIPASDEVSPLDGTELNVMPEELVRVAIRYKQPGASEDDAAAEVAASLLPSDVPTTLEDTDADMKWAAAVAATAEVVKGSPYVTDQTLLTAGKIIKGYEGGDADRLEFKALFQALETLLAMAD